MRSLLITAAFIGAWSFANNIDQILPGWLLSALSIAALLAIPTILFTILKKVTR